MHKYILIPLIVALLAVGGWYFFFANPAEAPAPDTTGNGSETPQATYQNASSDKIVVTTPKPGETVGSVIPVVGSARGGWYFEASFPIFVKDGNGNVIGQSIGTADGEWMTAEFVPFKSFVTVSSSYKGPAMLVLQNDNPSGKPEFEASISIPIVIE